MLSLNREELPQFEEYLERVKVAIVYIAPSVVDDYVNVYAQTIDVFIADIKKMYDAKYSILDAVTNICLMDQNLDEDYACQSMEVIRKRYENK